MPHRRLKQNGKQTRGGEWKVVSPLSPLCSPPVTVTPLRARGAASASLLDWGTTEAETLTFGPLLPTLVTTLEKKYEKRREDGT